MNAETDSSRWCGICLTSTDHHTDRHYEGGRYFDHSLGEVVARRDWTTKDELTIRLELPWTKPPITANRVRGNPYAQAAKVENARAVVSHCIQKQRPDVAPTPCHITLHFRPSTRQIRDADGLYPTAKAAIDELVAQGVLPNGDDWRSVRAVTCRIHQPEPPAAMWLTIEPEEQT